MQTASVGKQKKYKPPKTAAGEETDPLLAVVCDADSMYHLLHIDLLCAYGRFRTGFQGLLF